MRRPVYFRQDDALKCGALATPVTFDWHGDGKFDLLLNSANADLLKQVGERTAPGCSRTPARWRSGTSKDTTSAPAVADFDADGVPDFLGGAEDGRLYFLRTPARKKIIHTAEPSFLRRRKK